MKNRNFSDFYPNEGYPITDLDIIIREIDDKDKHLLLLRHTLKMDQLTIKERQERTVTRHQQLLKSVETTRENIKFAKEELLEKKLDELEKHNREKNELFTEHQEKVKELEKRIEAQVALRDVEFDHKSPDFGYHLDALHDLIQYSRSKLIKYAHPKFDMLVNIMYTQQRAVNTCKSRLDAIKKGFQFQFDQLDAKCNKFLLHKKDMEEVKKEFNRRLNEYNEKRGEEEASYCEELKAVYQQILEKHGEMKLIYNTRAELMNKMVQESSEKLAKAKEEFAKLQIQYKLRDKPEVVNEPKDLLAMKARLRVGKLILKQLKDQNVELTNSIISMSNLTNSAIHSSLLSNFTSSTLTPSSISQDMKTTSTLSKSKLSSPVSTGIQSIRNSSTDIVLE